MYRARAGAQVCHQRFSSTFDLPNPNPNLLTMHCWKICTCEQEPGKHTAPLSHNVQSPGRSLGNNEGTFVQEVLYGQDLVTQSCSFIGNTSLVLRPFTGYGAKQTLKLVLLVMTFLPYQPFATDSMNKQDRWDMCVYLLIVQVLYS